ncbi:MAG TPA: M28 family peptidase [Myxococcales bacterium]|jgi:hypothetical protein
MTPSPRHERLASWGGALLLAAVALLAIRALGPPPPAPESAPADAFSAQRARRHLEVIAREPHPTGSRANEEVRAYLVQTLRGLGLEVETQKVNVALRAAGRIASAELVNVAGRLRGTAGGEAKALMLASHYDSVPQCPAAADDGSGVATLLETARALKSGPPPRRDVIFLFTDGEELALLGAQGFVAEHPWRGDVGAVLNFEARGNRGTAFMFETSPHVPGLVDLLRASPRPSASSAVTALAQALPHGTDLAVFTRAGYPGLGFAFADGFADYHSRFDDLERLAPASVQDEGDQALALARTFARSKDEIAKKGEAVYFDLFRLLLVSYSATTARVLAALTVLAFCLLVVRRRRQGLRGSGLAAGAALTAASALVAAGLSFAMSSAAAWEFSWELLARQGPFRGAQALAVAAATLLLGLGLLRRRFVLEDLATGVLAFWAAGLAALAVFGPAASFPVQWPLLLMTAALASGRRWAIPVAGAAALAVLAPFGWALHLAAGVGLPSATALFAALGFALFLPLLSAASRRALLLSGAALLVAAAALIPVARAAVSAGAKSDYLAYAVDADAGSARWLGASSPMPHGLSEKLVPKGAAPVLGDLDPSFAIRRTAPAPLVDRPAPDIRIAERAGPPSPRRRVELTIRSQARCLDLWQESGAPLATVSVQGKPVPDLVRFSAELDARLMRLVSQDRSPPLWKMKHCGPGGEELRVVVDAPSGERVPVRLVEEFDGLPPLTERRADGLVPAMGGDVTLVARRLRF